MERGRWNCSEQCDASKHSANDDDAGNKEDGENERRYMDELEGFENTSWYPLRVQKRLVMVVSKSLVLRTTDGWSIRMTLAEKSHEVLANEG
jgi:hypothetical protein